MTYEEFSDVTESNVFLNTQPEANALGEGAMPVHPEAIACPKAMGTEESDVSSFRILFNNNGYGIMAVGGGERGQLFSEFINLRQLITDRY